MSKIYIFLAMVMSSYIALGCDCIENNHTLAELDDYSLINSQLAVFIETGDAVIDGENIMLEANIVSYIKRNGIRTIYLKGKNEEDYNFKLSNMANKKLIFIDVAFFGDTIWVNHCKQLWVWYDDPNKIKNDPDYSKIMQRQDALTSFMDKTNVQKHNTITYTNLKKTSLGKYKNKLPEGRWIHFTYYGKPFAKGIYSAGVREGHWIETYYKQKSGVRKTSLFKVGFAKGNYVNGLKDGKWIIYNKDKGSEVFFYKDGQVFNKM